MIDALDFHVVEDVDAPAYMVLMGVRRNEQIDGLYINRIEVISDDRPRKRIPTVIENVFPVFLNEYSPPCPTLMKCTVISAEASCTPTRDTNIVMRKAIGTLN